MSAAAPSAGPTRILILGGGFAGVFAARHLEKYLRNRPGAQITLVSRDNFLLITPLMFEACSGTLEFHHSSVGIREFLRKTNFIEAAVDRIDLDNRTVHANRSEGQAVELGYDHLVLALGSITNRKTIPGSDLAFTFKTLADVFLLRNHLLERLELADAETDPVARQRLLTLVVIGGGLVGTEAFGELTATFDVLLPYYPRIRRDELRLYLLQAQDRIMPEVPAELADYAVEVFTRRPGVTVQTNAEVESIEPGRVHLKDQTIEAGTIVLSAGILPSPVVAGLPMQKEKHGHLMVEPTMRSKDRPEIWALGDCAHIPTPDGGFYPSLAQHAMREAKVLAQNLRAALDNKPLKPFDYQTLGIMAALGHNKGLGTVLGINLRGFIAWWARRTYYLFVVPRWPQRFRIVTDWTLALFFRPEIAKIDLASEATLLKREGPAGMIPAQAQK